ncbi:MAG: succinylglutamate desuccinylase/aspartoacylase family protein, partial [Pseudomonadota bacterium]
HSGGKASFFVPCVLTSETSDAALSRGNVELARAFGLPLNWVLGEHNDPRSLNAAAARAGVPMIAAELGGGGGADPDITAMAEAGLLGCLKHLGILAGTPTRAEHLRRVRIASPLQSLYAPADGLFDRHCQAGQDATAGQLAGTLQFPFEPEREPLALGFPTSGFVLAHVNRGMVRRGELLALVVETLPSDSPD